MTSAVVDERGVSSMVRGLIDLPWPDLRYNALLPEPPRGHAIELAGCLVVHRHVDEGLRAPHLVVYFDGQVVAMGDRWRGLCHFRGWQLDPVLLFRHPWSWPVERQTLWHKMCLSLLTRDFAAWQELPQPKDPFDTEPLTWTHPECGKPPPCPIPIPPDLQQHVCSASPSTAAPSRRPPRPKSPSASAATSTRSSKSPSRTTLPASPTASPGQPKPSSESPGGSTPATSGASTESRSGSTTTPTPPLGQMRLFE